VVRGRARSRALLRGARADRGRKGDERGEL